MLRINDAINLYKMLVPYTPEIETGSDILEFIGTIITNIRNSKEPWILVDSIMLMQGTSLEELKENTSAKNIELFIGGLAENNFLSLIMFCKELGFNG